jgi:hypothetical protein
VSELNDGVIGSHNVGRIAERIVSNELEYRGFRVSDLNKEGMSANADLLAVKDGKPFQIQVKGATEENGWWVNYGFGHPEVIGRDRPMYNSCSSFYKADFVVLVSVKSPSSYCCVVFPVAKAEEAAQLNLDYAYRTLKKDGSAKKPGKVWAAIGYISKSKDASIMKMRTKEQEILTPFVNKWDVITRKAAWTTVWPWQAFDRGVFWAILAAALVCLIAANIIDLVIGKLSE